MEAFSLSSAVFVAGALCLAVFLSIRFLKKKKKGKSRKSVLSSGIPEGMEENFRCGVDPCSFGIPVMYTLHTCRHCVKLKDFLDKHGIECRLVYVDDFSDPARKDIMTVMRSYNPRGSFPTLVIPDGRSVVGFREESVKNLFGID